MGKVCFFFGAGAECGSESFNLPSGAEYTIKTMRQKSNKLYLELKKYYNNRLPNDYVHEYKTAFLFEKGSHTFNEIIFRGARNIIESNDIITDYDDYAEIIDIVKSTINTRESEDSLKRERWAEFKRKAAKAYDLLIKDYEIKAHNREPSKRYFEDYIKFYGAVEKDFSSIIDPQKVGLTQFWRVINYYWSAFFTILKPASEQFNWYSEGSNFYNYVLNNLSDAVTELWTNFDYDPYNKKPGNYYLEVKNNFEYCKVMTTNYTPFVEHYFGKNSIYLGGKLSEFEYPTSLSVKDIRKVAPQKIDFIFPFIMTQAPIKPLIVSNQVREYSKMLEALNLNDYDYQCTSRSEETILVIIGYSIGDADNHINSILREFACKKHNRIIYCKLLHENNQTADAVQKEICRKLHLDKSIENSISNIEILFHNGNAKELVQAIKRITDSSSHTDRGG